MTLAARRGEHRIGPQPYALNTPLPARVTCGRIEFPICSLVFERRRIVLNRKAMNRQFGLSIRPAHRGFTRSSDRQGAVPDGGFRAG